jgi:hypothetical protein
LLQDILAKEVNGSDKKAEDVSSSALYPMAALYKKAKPQ